MLETGATKQVVIEATDQCVMCGLCLPHCPTYMQAKNEAESPRGRIALVRALYENKLEPKPILVNHLDNCLACMTCESVCPANVNYEIILDAGRELTRDHHSFFYKAKQWLVLLILTSKSIRTLFRGLIKLYHNLGIYKLLTRVFRDSPNALRTFRLIPKPLQKIKLPNTYLSDSTSETRVVLFTSCASDLFSDVTITSAKLVLRALDCKILANHHVNCCGALHQHTGHTEKAKKLMQKFIDSFSNDHFDALISLATGCGAQLNRYPQLLANTAASELVAKHMDINIFVSEQLEKHKLQCKPLPEKVFVHKPCTHQYVSKDVHTVEKILSVIPDIQLALFQDPLNCCGAGGINNLSQAKLADNIIQNKITELISNDAIYLVTSNIGCAIHFQAQLKSHNSSVIVCHPITLLAQQLL